MTLALGVKEWFIVPQDCNLDIIDLVHFYVLFSITSISHFNTILNRFICWIKSLLFSVFFIAMWVAIKVHFRQADCVDINSPNQLSQRILVMLLNTSVKSKPTIFSKVSTTLWMLLCILFVVLSRHKVLLIVIQLGTFLSNVDHSKHTKWKKSHIIQIIIFIFRYNNFEHKISKCSASSLRAFSLAMSYSSH